MRYHKFEEQNAYTTKEEIQSLALKEFTMKTNFGETKTNLDGAKANLGDTKRGENGKLAFSQMLWRQ